MPPGATISPVILGSDKTQLSTFSGDKQAWPVYLGIGNIDKSIRRKPSERATILLAYIPVTKLECFSETKRQFEGYQLFHTCMAAILEPLVQAGNDGVKMVCADRRARLVFPILASYIADHPEQCLITCCMENRCPKCVVSPDKLGDPVHSLLRDHGDTVRILTEQSQGLQPDDFKEQGLRPIWPFWANLPHCDIFSCITPDLLHQLHKGFFKDHIVNWSTKSADGAAREIDARFQAMPPHPSLRHFKKGISLITQWTGTEYKNMEKVFLGVIAGIAPSKVVHANRGVLDFIHYAHFESHTSKSLQKLDKAWAAFHDNKQVFVELGIRKHFNIPKIHAAKHYVDAIRSRGTTDGFNSEATERLHIDYAKIGYRSTNKKGYIKQMTKWLTRQEKIHRFEAYLQWAVEDYHASAEAVDVDTENHQDGDQFPEYQGVRSESGSMSAAAGYSIPKNPSYLNVPLADVQKDFGAVDIIPCIETYLRRLGQPVPHVTNPKFSLFKRMYVWIPPVPQVSQQPIKDSIIATCPEAAKGPHKKAFEGQFSVALIREPESKSSTGNPLDGEWCLKIHWFCLYQYIQVLLSVAFGPYSCFPKHLAITLSLLHMLNGLHHCRTLTLILICLSFVLHQSIAVAAPQSYLFPKLNAAVISYLSLVKQKSTPLGIQPIFLTRILIFMSTVTFDILILFYFVVFRIY